MNYIFNKVKELWNYLQQKANGSENNEKIKEKKYQKILDDLSSRYPHVKALNKTYPRLNEVMANNSFVREILLTTPGDKKSVDLITKYLNSQADGIIERLKEENNRPPLSFNRPIEQRYALLYGEESRKNQIETNYELMVARYETDILFSTMPDLFLQQHIMSVQLILGHIPDVDKTAKKHLEDSYSYDTNWDVAKIQETDKMLIAGREQEMVDTAIEKESPEIIDYLIVTSSFQKFLIYLQHEAANNAEPTTANTLVEIETINRDYKLVLQKKMNDEDGDRMHRFLAEAFNVLSPFIDANVTQFKSVFMEKIELKEKIRWKREMKELQYIICHLSGEPFKELDKNTRTYVTTKKNTGDCVLEETEDVWARAANCFLNRYGRSIDGGSIQTPNAVRPIPKNQQELLDMAISILKHP